MTDLFVDKLLGMMTFLLAVAAFGLVMTALTYAELRQSVGPHWCKAPCS